MESPQPLTFIKTTVDELGVALLEICRPEKRNALSQSVIDDLVKAVTAVEKDDQARAVVLTGAPNGPFSGKYTPPSQRGLMRSAASTDVLSTPGVNNSPVKLKLKLIAKKLGQI